MEFWDFLEGKVKEKKKPQLRVVRLVRVYALEAAGAVTRRTAVELYCANPELYINMYAKTYCCCCCRD